MKTGKIFDFCKKIFPFPRSLTGKGVRDTLSAISDEIPLKICRVPTGSVVFDWTVPKEWVIKDAFVKDLTGRKIVDFQKSNLSVVNYSLPIHQTMSLENLLPHLYSLPNSPGAIPYVTKYYEEDWGFCLPDEIRSTLKPGNCEVFIDSELVNGELNYGELYIPGKSKKEILISTHICHPSMANDNVSGIAVVAFLAKKLLEMKDLKFSYRFIFIPGSIGSLVWMQRNEKNIKNIHAGLVLTGLGDKSNFTYKKSRQAVSEIDLIVDFLLKDKGKVIDFSAFGYDERQFCSPAFNLPVGLLMRSEHGTYPEYHTSLDNLDFVSERQLEGSIDFCGKIVQTFEKNKYYLNLYPKGEPQLGKRGIYAAMNSQNEDKKELQKAMLWVLNMSDGNYSLLSISQRAKIKIGVLEKAAEILQSKKIIKEIYV